MAITFLLLSILIPWTAVSTAPIDPTPDIDINRTLENVRAILDANPLLPRLSQDEILALLNNITAEDALKEVKRPVEVDRREKIMVVLPYQASNASDVTELFTKRPIITFVSSHSADREEIATEPTKKMKKDKSKPKKVSTTTPKTNDESKDLLNTEQNLLSALEKPNYHYSLVENVADFNNDFTDQHPVASSDRGAYEAFKPLPQPSKLDEGVPVEVRDIIKALDNEDKINNQYLPQEPSSNSAAADFEYSSNDSAMPPDMESLLKDLGLENPAQPPKSLAEGPDPLSSLDLPSVNEATGNDIKKRQQSNVTASEVTTAASTTTTSKSTKDDDEKSERPSMADLESSFGGSSADDDPSEAVLPPPRRNGFYYMVDWNSFLEVGDGDTKVNIRFNPKLGDPQRFIAVTVP